MNPISNHILTKIEFQEKVKETFQKYFIPEELQNTLYHYIREYIEIHTCTSYTEGDLNYDAAFSMLYSLCHNISIPLQQIILNTTKETVMSQKEIEQIVKSKLDFDKRPDNLEVYPEVLFLNK